MIIYRVLNTFNTTDALKVNLLKVLLITRRSQHTLENENGKRLINTYVGT